MIAINKAIAGGPMLSLHNKSDSEAKQKQTLLDERAAEHFRAGKSPLLVGQLNSTMRHYLASNYPWRYKLLQGGQILVVVDVSNLTFLP